MRVLSVFGTRPEAIKMAPVIRKLRVTAGIESIVCVTAQHRQMLDQALELFDIKPDHDLNLMRDGQSLAQLTASIFTHLDPVMEQVKPDWVLAVGDTTTVVTTCQVAFYRRIKFGHVEAGLRTQNKWHPFPEEINRRLASTMADMHFAPTEKSAENLRREGVHEEDIHVTGNPVIDALQIVAAQSMPPFVEEFLAQHKGKRLVLVTAHRRENFGQPIQNICRALKKLAERDDIHLAYPVHMNPNIHEPVKELLGDASNISLLEPLDYLPMVHLMRNAALILTDSGGLQEEAPSLGVPVLVLRETTERPEGVDAGTLKVVGTETVHIVEEATRLLDDPSEYAKMAKASNPYGDGHAAERIVDALLKSVDRKS